MQLQRSWMPRSWMQTALALAIGWAGVLAAPVRSVQLGDGSVAFARPPQLVGASSTFNTAYFWGARYYFTLTVPENAGEPLQKVVIVQDGGPDRARFDANSRRSEAYEGTPNRPGARLPLQSVTADPKTRAITVTFDPPVSPGRTVTIELYPVRNPDTGGVYLFGVTAFPAGELARGQFLGYGRIHIYDHDRGIFYRGWR